MALYLIPTCLIIVAEGDAGENAKKVACIHVGTAVLNYLPAVTRQSPIIMASSPRVVPALILHPFKNVQGLFG